MKGRAQIRAFIDEVRRRKITRVWVAYIGLAALLVGLIDPLQQPLGLPSWVMPTMIWVLYASFFLVVLVAWAFEGEPRKASGTLLCGSLFVWLLVGLALFGRKDRSQATSQPVADAAGAPADAGAPVAVAPPTDNGAPTENGTTGEEEAVPDGETATRAFLPRPTYHVVPVRTSDWVQVRGSTVYYRHGSYLGEENGTEAAPCSGDLRVVGDWDWSWREDGVRVTCLDDEWLSFDLSQIASRGVLAAPRAFNITNRGETVWGLHGNPRFRAPCLLSEFRSPNLWIQAVPSGVQLVPAPTPTDWVEQHPELDVCRGGTVAVTANPGARPFSPASRR